MTVFDPITNAPAPLWIADDAALAQHCARWRNCDAIAVDSEFIRRETYYPQPALLQVCDGSEVVLIDPLPITDWQPFAQLMADAGCVKVLHSASEDIEVFLRLGCNEFAALFDTQIAAPLCGFDNGMGYQRLVLALLGVELDKGATQTNWLQRPLTNAQQSYAVDDVWFLLLVYRKLALRLVAEQRMAWVLEETASRLGEIATQVDAQLSYLRIERGWQLKPAAQYRLRALCAWREGTARELDRPRKWILQDHAMIEMAQQAPQALAQLAAIDGIEAGSLRRFGNQWLQLLAQKPALNEPIWPQPLSREERDRLGQLRQHVERFCAARQLPAGMLLRKDEASAIIRSAQSGAWHWLESMPQWRRDLLQPVIAEWLAREAS